MHGNRRLQQDGDVHGAGHLTGSPPPAHHVRQSSVRRASGFTLTELVMVMLVVAILSFVAIPKVYDHLTFDSRGFTDQVRAAIQYAQRTAVAQRRNVCVAITATTLTLTKAAVAGSTEACGPAVTNPATGSAFVLSAPNGVSLSAATFSFDALGQVPATVTITVSGDTNRSITVEQLTGYVR
jgi:MSHA pilin protein MshC